MIKNRLLVTTALEETWVVNNDTVCTFLGEWCRIYSRKGKWSNIESELIPYHWDDRKKLKRDHDYLKELYESVIEILGNKLNEIHHLDGDKRHWRIILGPWLIAYLPIIFDRWEMLRISMIGDNKLYTSIRLKYNSDTTIPRDHEQFVDFFQTDLWNYNIFLRILEWQYKEKVTFIDKELAVENAKEIMASDNKPVSAKMRLLRLVDKCLDLVGGNRKIVFYNSYFPPKRLIILNLNLLQIPRFYTNNFKIQINKDSIDESLRANTLDWQTKSAFESFFFANVMKDIPVAYLEAFKQINIFTDGITLDPKTIVTANAHWGDEAFKVWTAKKLREGKKLIICQHGGALPPLFDTFQHEEAIADLHTTWFKPFHPKHLQLSPNKIGDNKIKSTKKYCMVIGLESTRYSHRATAYAIGHQTIKFTENSIQFFRKLDEGIQSHFKLKPYFNMGIGTAKIYADVLGEEKILTGVSFYKALKQSRLIVCTYPNTTFSEAMASGIPTILLYIPEYFETVPEADELIGILKRANILFNDPENAAEHINKIWNNVEEWWHDENVEKAKKYFFESAFDINRNWLPEWKSLFKDFEKN